MPDSFPIVSQIYSDDLFKIAVYKLFDQAPGLVSWALDNIIDKLSSRDASVVLKEVFPTSQINLEKSEITICYSEKKKVTYYWICLKLIQLLLWNESSPVKSMDYLKDYCKISFNDINVNILKTQQIISDYASHLTSNPAPLRFGNQCSIESNTLPSYQNVISDHDSVGTSNDHLSLRFQQNGNFPETNGHSYEHNSNNSIPKFKLEYCFNGSSKSQARDFINDYDYLALKNKWTPEDKMEFFPNHLEKDALNWYLTIQEHLTSWRVIKTEFMQKFLAD